VNKQIQDLLDRESKECLEEIYKLTKEMCSEIETDDQALIDVFNRKIRELESRMIQITNIALEHEEKKSTRKRIKEIKKRLEDIKVGD
jgi:hypothetical protein